MKDEPGLTVMLVPDEGHETRTLRISYRRLKLLAVAGGLLGLLLLAMAGSWWYLAARSARVDELEAQVSRLEGEKAQMEALSRQLADLEDRYESIRDMFGSARAPSESHVWLPAVGGRPASRRPADDRAGPSLPESWPLTERGFVTQPLLEGSDGEHPGLDIAVATDSYVRAAGGGTVVEVGKDPVYGNYVVVEHLDGYRSLYAHASLTLVEEGEPVRRNEVIALSGSTGRSTAPHLHFEIQRAGEPVDPMSLVTPP